MGRLLLAVIVALCAFASPSLANSRHHSNKAHVVKSAHGHHHASRESARTRHHAKGPRHSVRKRDAVKPRLKRHSHAASSRRVASRRHVARRDAPVLQEGRASLTTTTEATAAPASTHSAGNARAVALAERYLGTNPTGKRSLWCANFLGMIEKKAGRRGTGSDLARSYANYGKKVAHPQKGDIAVLGRGKRGGHVGYFVGWAGKGKAVLISGNGRGGKVTKGTYSAARIIAWRRPA